jgi:hypothetical protein
LYSNNKEACPDLNRWGLQETLLHLAGNVPAACMNSSGLQEQATACRNTIAMQDQVTAFKPRCDSSSSSSTSLSNSSGTSHQQQLHAACHNGICAHQ